MFKMKSIFALVWFSLSRKAEAQMDPIQILDTELFYTKSNHEWHKCKNFADSNPLYDFAKILNSQENKAVWSVTNGDNWIGGYKPGNEPDKKDGWKWVVDGTDVTYTNWEANHPIYYEDRHKRIVLGHRGGWTSRFEDYKYHCVFRRRVTQSPTTSIQPSSQPSSAPRSEVLLEGYFVTPSEQSADTGSVNLTYALGPEVDNYRVDVKKKDCNETVAPIEIITNREEVKKGQIVTLSFGFDTSLLLKSNLLKPGSTNAAGTLEFCVFAQTYANISLYGNDTTKETLMVMNMTNYALEYSGAQTGFFTVEDIQLSEVEATDGGDGGFSLGNMTLTTVLCSSSSTDEVFGEQTDTVFLCLISDDLDTKLNVTSLKVTYALNGNPVEMVLKNVETDYEAEFISIEPAEGDHTVRIEVAIIAEFFAFGNTELDFSGFVDIGFVQASDVRQRFNEVESTDFGTKVIIATNEGCFGQLFTMVQNMF